MPVGLEDPVGSVCEVKKLYSHSTSLGIFCNPWSEIQDPVLEAQRRKQAGQSSAIIHRFLKEGDAWVSHSIEIKSPLLRPLFDRIFHNFPGWAPYGSPYSFFRPYRPLVIRWKAILETYSAEKHDRTKLEMNYFIKEAKELISVHLSALEEATSSGVISFDLLWLLLDPGRLFVSEMGGNIHVSKLVGSRYIEGNKKSEREEAKLSHWKLTMAQVDWNGSYSGFATHVVDVQEYAEPILITCLVTTPLDFHPGQHDIRARLLARGRRFESLRGCFVMVSTGKKLVEQRDIFGDVSEVTEPVDGRIVIDAFAYYHCQHRTRPQLGRGSGNTTTSEDTEANDNRNEDLTALSDEECILTVPLLRGFDLKAKKWCRFNLDEVREPSWNDLPYDNLEISDGDKQLLMAFADYHRFHDTGFDDFVKDKGKGIIILLSGPPGVGKTLSAEAVAEKSRIALYVLSAGELGSDSERLEAALTAALTCCQLWGAAILIDEADVFLETREPNSLERNELVAIFLRHLEYYEGLLFLTTNRATFIDPAFRSRVDLTLTYSNLDRKTRRRVWVNFIKRLPESDFCLEEADIDELSTHEVNGREIKSAIKMGLILAARDRPLRLKHLNIVLENRKRERDSGLQYCLPTQQVVIEQGTDLLPPRSNKRAREA
ncbi:P-loop containing nucleoside triphosphate hydrolase protein [Tricladium varicosporioides]|nr:P-loop containing nucleoside triphosphate hydrolase protein [Hymenoscyphus varicosporioides]